MLSADVSQTFNPDTNRMAVTTPKTSRFARNWSSVRSRTRRATVAEAPNHAGVMGAPLDSPTDPRWVLATRTAEQLEGSLLRPEPRDRLVRLGQMLGLSHFDANLVIAIVQDQARRGYAPKFCPLAAEPRLRLIPLLNEKNSPDARRRRALALAWGLVLFIAAELVVLAWLVD